MNWIKTQQYFKINLILTPILIKMKKLFNLHQIRTNV
jgi:hypothetical protein